ncbi:HPr kinase/phosphorylase [Pseudohoeflea suaedae]|nr:HPr kinase/phosphorylase [Pseudohoeflea suaedae]
MNDPALTLAEGAPVHATAVVIGERGLLLTGASGSGKTTTALRCMSSARTTGTHAALIADDGVNLAVSGGRVIARCPQPIAGRAEIRGTGIFSFAWRQSAVLEAVVMAASPEGAGRLPPDDEFCMIGTCRLKLIRVDYRSPVDPLQVILSALAAKP